MPGPAGGIGAAVVDRLADFGWTVHGWDVREHELAAAATTSVVDIASSRADDEALARVPRPLRLFVANAGYAEFGQALEVEDDLWLRTIAINLGGSFWCMPCGRAQNGN